MFKKLVPFNSMAHAKKKLKPVTNFSFAAGSYIASITIAEIPRAASVYPIVFLKDGNELKLYALMGLRQGENLYVDADGKWNAGYIPAIIRRYPFALGKSEGRDDFIICLDEASEFLSESEGEPLVNSQGKPAELLDKVKDFLSDFHRSNLMTSRFCKELTEWDLLTALNIQIKEADGKVQTIGGCFGVNEKRLNELSDDKFLELRKRGALPLIYAHLISLPRVEELIRMYEEKNRRRI